LEKIETEKEMIQNTSGANTIEAGPIFKKYDFNRIKEDKILEKLRRAEEALEGDDLDQALVEFNKVLFYDKTIPEVFVEKAEIYIKLCDFSSAISNFKKALNLKKTNEWQLKMN